MKSINEVKMSDNVISQRVDKLIQTGNDPIVGVEIEVAMPLDVSSVDTDIPQDATITDLYQWAKSEFGINFGASIDLMPLIAAYNVWKSQDSGNIGKEIAERVTRDPSSDDSDAISQYLNNNHVISRLLSKLDSSVLEQLGITVRGGLSQTVIEQIIEDAIAITERVDSPDGWDFTLDCSWASGYDDHQSLCDKYPFARLFYYLIVENNEKFVEQTVSRYRDSDDSKSLLDFAQQVHGVDTWLRLLDALDINIEVVQNLVLKRLRDDIVNSGFDQGWQVAADHSIHDNDLDDSKILQAEVISPPLAYSRALDEISRMFEYLVERGAYTNHTTGFHCNVNLSNTDHNNLDGIKLGVMLGDRYVLEKFGRLFNKFTVPALDRIQAAIEAGHSAGFSILESMKTDMIKFATHLFENYVLREKYTSINIKPGFGYVEFRSLGNTDYINRWPELVATINRFIYVYSLACDPTAARQEYATKLYKMIGDSGIANDPTQSILLKPFVEYASGQIDRDMMKTFLKNVKEYRDVFKNTVESVSKNYSNSSSTAYIIGKFSSYIRKNLDLLYTGTTFNVRSAARTVAMNAVLSLPKTSSLIGNAIQPEQVNEVKMSPSVLSKRVAGLMKSGYDPVVGVEIEVYIPLAAYGEDLPKKPPSTEKLSLRTTVEDFNDHYELDQDHELPVIDEYNEWLNAKTSEQIGFYGERPAEFRKSKIIHILELNEVGLSDEAIEDILGQLGIASTADITTEVATRIVDDAVNLTNEVGGTVFPIIAAPWFTSRPTQGDTALANKYPYARTYYDIFIDNAGSIKHNSQLWDDVLDHVYDRANSGDTYYSLGTFFEEVYDVTNWSDVSEIVFGSSYEESNGDNYGHYLYNMEDALKNDVANIGWSVTIDPTLRDRYGYVSMEIVMPELPYKRAMGVIGDTFNYLLGMGAITTEDCGFHINVSVGGIEYNNLDYVKMAVLLGDEHVLKTFDRLHNEYTKPAIKLVTSAIAQSRSILSLLQSVKENLRREAKRLVDKSTVTKYTSINPKGNYIEFRSAGNANYLSRWSTIRATIDRFVVIYVAGGSDLYDAEYENKIQKLIYRHAPSQQVTTSDTVAAWLAEYGYDAITLPTLLARIKTFRENQPNNVDNNEKQ